MAVNAFEIFGDLKIGNGYERNLALAETRLKTTEKAVESLESKAKDLTGTNAIVQRSVEKLSEKIDTNRQRLAQAGNAYEKGVISANQFGRALIGIDKNLDTLNSKLKDTNAKLSTIKPPDGIAKTNSAFASFVGNVASNAFSNIYGLVKEGGNAWLDYSSKLEQAKIGFTSMTGSAEIAEQHLQDLQNFAKTTPFQFEELVTASQKLQGVGFSAKQIIPILTDVGNSLAAAGRIDELPQATKALGDIQAKGKLAGQEIIQLANAGIPAFEALATATGKSRAEIVALSQKGAISAEVFFQSLHKYNEMRGLGDAMEKQSHTFAGAMSNIEDALKQASATALKPFFEKISTLATDTATEIAAQGGDLEAVGGVIGSHIAEGLSTALALAVETILSKEGEHIKEFWTKGKVTTGSEDSILSGVTNSLLKGLGYQGKELEAAKVAVQKILNDPLNLDGMEATKAKMLAILNRVPADRENTLGLDDSGVFKFDNKIKLGNDSGKYDFSRQIADSDRYYSILEAKQQAFMTFTLEEESQKALNVSNIRQNSFDDQIRLQTASFNAQIAGANGDKEKIEKLEAEKYKAISDIQKKGQLDEINTQKQIAGFERQIIEQRRAALIKFKQDAISSTQFTLNSNTLDISRAIETGNIGAEQGFDRLKDITKDAYAEISRLSLESYQAQLQDETLSKEQRLNLTTEMYQAEQKIAEDSRRSLIALEDQKWSKIREIVQERSRETLDAYSALSVGYQSFADFFNQGSFSSKGFQNILTDLGLPKLQAEIAKTQKEYLDWQDVANAAHESLSAYIIPSEGMSKLSDSPDSKAAQADARTLQETANLAKQAFQDAKNQIPDMFASFANIGVKLKESFNFDDVASEMMAQKHGAEIASLTEQITLNQTLLQIEKDKSDKGDKNLIERLKSERTQLAIQKDNLTIAQAIEDERRRANSIPGLLERNGNLERRDPDTLKGLSDELYRQSLQQRNTLLNENFQLEYKIAHAGEDAALRYQNAWLQASAAIKEANAQAIESQAKSYAKMQDASTIHIEQIRANIMAAVSEQSSVTDMLSQNLLKVGDIFSNAVSQWDGSIKGFFVNVAKGFGNLVTDIISQLIRVAIYQSILKIIGMASGGGKSTSLTDSAIPSFGGGGGGSLGGVFAATGGLIQGRGSSTSDSIRANLSDGEYVMPANVVSNLGPGYFDALRSGVSPSMLMPSNSYSNSNSSVVNNYHIQAPMYHSGGNPQQSNMSAAAQRSAIMKQLEEQQRRNK